MIRNRIRVVKRHPEGDLARAAAIVAGGNADLDRRLAWTNDSKSRSMMNRVNGAARRLVTWEGA